MSVLNCKIWFFVQTDIQKHIIVCTEWKEEKLSGTEVLNNSWKQQLTPLSCKPNLRISNEISKECSIMLTSLNSS